MKRITLLIAAAVMGLSARAEMWRNLSEANWLSGPKLSEGSLSGKVVLVDVWSADDAQSRALLPRMQEIWSSFRSKPFVLLGSHRGADADSARAAAGQVTFPVYADAGLAERDPSGGTAPYVYVVNHRGKVVYAGRSDRDATEALVTALGWVGRPPDLLPGVTPVKYKAMAKQLVLGKSIKSNVRKLESDIKQFARAKGGSQVAQRQEAQAILRALEEGRRDVEAEIRALKSSNPEEALKLIRQFQVTFPTEGAAYKDDIPVLTARAAEQKAAAKAAAKAAKASRR